MLYLHWDLLTQNQNIPHSATTNQTKLSLAAPSPQELHNPQGKPGEKKDPKLQAVPLLHFILHFLSSHVAESQMVKGVTQRKLSIKIIFLSNVALH